MNSIKTLITVICSLLFFTTNIKAQDSSNCGIWVDGTLVDSISNWNFKKIMFIYPLKMEWKDKYPVVQIQLGYYKDFNDPKEAPLLLDQGELKPEDYSDYADAEYGVVNMCTNYTNHDGVLTVGNTTQKLTHMALDKNCDCKTWEPLPTKRALHAFVMGYKIIAYEEVYSQASNSIIKKPKFDRGTILYESKKVIYNICVCGYKKKEYMSLIDGSRNVTQEELECVSCKSYISAQCKPYGRAYSPEMKKVDYVGKFYKILKQQAIEIKKEEPLKTIQPAKKKTK